MRRIVLYAAAVCFAFALVRTVQAKQPFEGTRWKVTITPDQEAPKNVKPFDDVLTFKGGKFESQAFKKQGFEAAPYEEDTRGITVSTFKSTLESDKYGKAVWSGTITASEIDGDMTFTKKDGTEIKYTFKGEKEQ